MITVSEDKLDDLTDRLEKARFPDQLDLDSNTAWSYGTGVCLYLRVIQYISNIHL